MQSNDEILARLHETYHAPLPEGPIRTPSNPHGLSFLFRDAQPGTAEWARAHLVGASAPEPLLERWDATGAENFGPVEVINPQTGKRRKGDLGLES